MPHTAKMEQVRAGPTLILHRYINRQVFVTTVLVTFILVMVLVSGRFIKYLAEAAAGQIAADALFLVMAFRLPEFLQMILPLSLYISLLLVLGRMHMDNEMVVLQAGGQGHGRIIRSLVVPVLVAVSVVALFSLYVTPRGDAEVNRIFEEQKGRSVLELLTPGRFLVRGSDGSQRATYAESLNREDGYLENVFVADARFDDSQAGRVLTVWAHTGRLVQDENGINYLELRDGYQYQGKPGEADYQEVAFEKARVRIGSENTSSRPPKVRGRTTGELLESPGDNQAVAELQWRWSLVLTVPIMCLAAIPLAKVNPRQGRFLRMIPAVLGYMLYVGLLLTMRSWMADSGGERPWYYSMIWIHALAAVAVFFLYYGDRLWRRRRNT
ncbi:LPS export ABC transporter permease LptF [Alloalcanivorax xenomutans]|jgi:lipopolysaccharide export system permease protein|uniref:Lipopolysaccharide export system permease protein LptF n=1 Tax=Alloalcanivorax xenomutans TaxID=1094342 RepID=A0A9Q3W8M7_9GAMM|nr:LPS export ABC transporter permease LptF [Alloalcanivorax xenomutans]MCE7511271.1 LPS export ABC transporter permease LptF [Alloalcanivorax xenomutans]MCE7525842.1 LPS export ABC transporter permease LptF [Alloalcanivorax xenomutans]WOA30711.1 LPS export ABC transporter permease LptF [Alloalcanivorax xenomutans]WOD27703.1 LPS export ABC transporter permease LptF [Alloalcanivorax xenomutans]SOC24633.1 lipopolysaccharide export system permease protein [Alloalcanivorax xenomutans]